MGGKRDRGVSFCGSVSVVLIPERSEYKIANCDLWWNREDYFSFHQSAFSELKLFSLYENICPREARKKLYQPTDADRETDGACSYGEFFETDSDNPEESMKENIIDSDVQVNVRPMQKISSIDQLAQNAENNLNRMNPKLMPKESSIEKLCSKAAPKEEEVFDGLLHHTSSVPMDLCSAAGEEEEELTLPIESPTKVSAEAEAEYFLSFCVQMSEAEQLCTKSKRRGSKQRRSKRTTDEADPANSLTFVLGLFSFTLPIVGYYVMHYCQ